MAFKDANTLYRQQDYRGAVDEVRRSADRLLDGQGDCTDPMLVASYFYLANSYDNLYRPARRGEANNDALLTKAIDNYKKSADLDNESPDQDARAAVSCQRLRSRQAERSVAVGADPPEDD